MAQTYVKIYSYKRVKIDEEILDILYVDDLTLAEEDNGNYKILAGKYEGKYVSRFGNDFDNHDFCCQPITLIEKNLLTNFNLDDIDAINMENYRLKCKYVYYKVLRNDGQITLQETDDKRIIEAFEHALNPTVADELSELISNGKSGHIVIDADLFSKMSGKENSLTTQDPNQYKTNIDDYKISEKYESLKRKIIGLDYELRILLANINKNITLSHSSLPSNKIKELKTGILILGPRGTGKTFMIENMADLFEVPSTIEDATRYTPSAYQGADVEDMLMNLYANSGEKKEVFEHGIVFIDEIDKICKRTDPKDYALKESIQNSLLTILRGSIIHKKVRRGFTEQPITLDTSKLTFVLSGAFEEIIDNDNITKDDLIKYGMIPQLADRIQLFIKTKNPGKEELKKALVDGEFSYIKLFEEYLSLFKIPLEVDDDFIDYIVDKAYNSGMGYRALSTALTEYLNDILFDLYAGKVDVVKLSRKITGDNNE